MEIYNKIYICKIVFFCVEYACLIIYFLLYFVLGFCYNSSKECYTEVIFFCLVIPAGVLYLLNFILIIVCLSYQSDYVLSFMNKINYDLEKNKIDYKWNVAVFIHSLFILIYIILFRCLNDKLEFMDKNYNQIEHNEHGQPHIIYIRNNNDVSTTERDVREYKRENNDLINKNKDLNKKISDITQERDTLIKEKETLEQSIVEIKKERDTLKIEKAILQKDIFSVTSEKNTLIKEKDTLIIERDNYKRSYEQIINDKNKDKYIINSILPGEEVMSINFVSMANNDIANYSLCCKNTDLFIKEEERLYEDFPKFKKYETYFEANGKRIKRFLTLEENKIKDKDVINMFIIEE